MDLYGVLSTSQIVRASSSYNNKNKNKKRRNNTAVAQTTPPDSLGYFRLVLEEITFRQERIIEALDQELGKKGEKDEAHDLARKIDRIANRRAEVCIALEKVTEMKNTLKKERETSLPSVRRSIVDLGFESVLNDSSLWLLSNSKRSREFGRPRGFDGPVYHTPLGVPVLVGTQGSHNDELFRSISQGTDLWFQAEEGYRGSRVLLRTSLVRGLKGSKACTQMAADLAAYYSDFRWDDDVPIMYTDSRHVAKRGTKAGQMKKRKSLGCMVGHPGAVVKDIEGNKKNAVVH